MTDCYDNVIILGTKLDLREDMNTVKELESYGSPGAAGYMECSALTQKGLNEVFDFAVKVASSERTTNTEKTEDQKLQKKAQKTHKCTLL